MLKKIKKYIHNKDIFSPDKHGQQKQPFKQIVKSDVQSNKDVEYCAAILFKKRAVSFFLKKKKKIINL